MKLTSKISFFGVHNSKNLAQAQLNNFLFIRSLKQEDFFFQFTNKFYNIAQYKN